MSSQVDDQSAQHIFVERMVVDGLLSKQIAREIDRHLPIRLRKRSNPFDVEDVLR
jgi:hypothetical protein